jgi:hypothetical protein
VDMDDSASSSMESNDTYGSVAALFFYVARKQGMATALEGGMHQESVPRFGFQGQLKQPMDNRKVGAPMVLNADMDQLMESGSPACCHTTVQQRARSFQDALEMLHLTGETGDSALSLRDAILISLYPELDDKEYENRFLGMKGSDYWAEYAGQVRLVKCQRTMVLLVLERRAPRVCRWEIEIGLHTEWCGQCRAAPFGTSWTMSWRLMSRL